MNEILRQLTSLETCGGVAPLGLSPKGLSRKQDILGYLGKETEREAQDGAMVMEDLQGNLSSEED